MSDKEVARWQKQRAKGKWFFVIRAAIIFGVMIFLTRMLFDWLWGDMTEILLAKVVITLIASLFFGLTMWWVGEARYNNHMLDRKIHDGLKR